MSSNEWTTMFKSFELKYFADIPDFIAFMMMLSTVRQNAIANIFRTSGPWLWRISFNGNMPNLFFSFAACVLCSRIWRKYHSGYLDRYCVFMLKDFMKLYGSGGLRWTFTTGYNFARMNVLIFTGCAFSLYTWVIHGNVRQCTMSRIAIVDCFVTR